MSDTPRTDDRVVFIDGNPWVNAPFARGLERELNAANDRIQSLIEERDRANRLADWKWNLRDEFQLLLGTDKIEEGIEAVKELKRRIKRLEEESESNWLLAQSAIGSCAEMSSRIQRLVEAGDALYELCDPSPIQFDLVDQIPQRLKAWEEAKEAKP